MYARLLALVGLLYVSALVGWAGNVLPSGSKLVVLLRDPQGASAEVLDYMRLEAAEIVRPSGARVEWLSNATGIDVAGGVLVVVDLRGACFPSPLDAHVDSVQPKLKHLGSTEVADGKVLPFSSVDCDAVWEFVASGLRREMPGRREFLFGRALGRVLAHEIYHVVAKTERHSHYGAGKSAVSAQELLADRFDFDSNALLRLHKSSAEATLIDDFLTR